jgi:hypothetical protein
MSIRYLSDKFRDWAEAVRNISQVVNSHLRDDAQPERWDIVNGIGIPSSAPPVLSTFKGNTAAYFFASNSENVIYYSFELPRTYKEGTAVKPVLSWSTISVSSGSVKWQLDYAIQKPGAAYSLSSSTVSVLASATATAFHYMNVQFPSITASEIGSILLCRLARMGANVSDNFEGRAYLLNFKIHIQNDTSRGAQYEYDKFDRG